MSQGHLQNPVTKSWHLGKDFDYANVVDGVNADGFWDLRVRRILKKCKVFGEKEKKIPAVCNSKQEGLEKAVSKAGGRGGGGFACLQ